MTCAHCDRPLDTDVAFRWHVDADGVVRLEPVHPEHVTPPGAAA